MTLMIMIVIRIVDKNDDDVDNDYGDRKDAADTWRSDRSEGDCIFYCESSSKYSNGSCMLLRLTRRWLMRTILRMMMEVMIMMMRVILLMTANDHGEHEDGVNNDGNDDCDRSNDYAGGDISNDNVAVVVLMVLMITISMM